MTRHMLYLIRLGAPEEDEIPDLSKEGFPYDEKYPYEGQDDERDDDDYDEEDWEEADAEARQNQE